VVAFTATQIPDIASRRYPPVLAGRGYPDGIPIIEENDLEKVIKRERVDVVVFSYSDVSDGLQRTSTPGNGKNHSPRNGRPGLNCHTLQSRPDSEHR
jgi:hypothetical protein